MSYKEVLSLNGSDSVGNSLQNVKNCVEINDRSKREDMDMKYLLSMISRDSSKGVLWHNDQCGACNDNLTNCDSVYEDILSMATNDNYQNNTSHNDWFSKGAKSSVFYAKHKTINTSKNNCDDILRTHDIEDNW